MRALQISFPDLGLFRAALFVHIITDTDPLLAAGRAAVLERMILIASLLLLAFAGAVVLIAW